MSALPIKKSCPSCGRIFAYNPSVGDFGSTCPYCFGSASFGAKISKAIVRILNVVKGE